ncbi:MAG: M42 family metallopeptidase [Anaerolineae bacterium]|nr:M42 family metallopeptidase [Anaerolineae bacterium]
MLDVKAHLKTLVEAHAPSGYEGPIRDILREAWEPLTDSLEQDKLGSLIGIKKGSLKPARKIMLAAHMDEIGLMVRDVVDGFIFVHRISGVDNRVMMAQPVRVHGRQSLSGIVASIPPHLLSASARRKYPTFDELIVDVGLPAAEVNDLVRIGDLITADVPLLELQGKKVAGKAMDDRASVAAVTVCLDMLRDMSHQWDVYAAATVQEETGLYGAATAAYHIQPDIAIALDVTFAPQPGIDGDEAKAMGDGPTLGIGPNFHAKLGEKIREIAKTHEIKLQDEIIPGASGTDAWAIQVANEGVPTALFGIPIRNMHSPVETVDLRDIERAGRLMAHFIASLDADFLAAIEWDELKKSES